MNFFPTDGAINIQDNWAREGGAVYIQDIYNGVIDTVNFKRNMASIQGGVFSFVNSQPAPLRSILTIRNSNILNSKAQISIGRAFGGVFYFDTVQLSQLHISNTLINVATATGDGGVFYVNMMKNGEILIDSITKIRNFQVQNTQLGSLFYSALEKTVKLIITNVEITCNQTALWSDATAAIGASRSYQAGAIYMETSTLGVISTSNTFQKCSSSQEGGIFYIVNSKLSEKWSMFLEVSALYGSVMKCSNCIFDFTDSTLDGSQAESGGALMVENNGQGIITRTSFKFTKALNQGGVLSVVQSGLAQLAQTVIQFVDCFNLFGNSARQGGVFYLNQPQITVHLINSVIQKASAADTAGVIYVQSGLGFILERSIVKDVFSSKSAFLFSTSTQLKLQILGSQVTCDSQYESVAVIEEFKNIKVASVTTNSFFLSGNQDTQVYTQNSKFLKCGMRDDGGLFRMEGKVNYTDEGSLYSDNSGVEGGVFSCSQCNITLVNSLLMKNQGKRGGVIKLEAQANFTAINSVFQFNLAQEIGGVIFVTTQSVFNVMSSKFLSNEANVSSTIDVLGANSYLINYIDGCLFNNNTADKNTVSLNKARALISNTKFRDNFSNQRSKNIFIAFAEVNITDSEFSSPEYFNIQSQLNKDFTMGAFIFIILDVKIIIRGSKFTNGLAKYGGAIYISGQSEITIDNCQIMKNQADLYGGAIFANSFKSIKVINNTKLLDNLANFQGDDFYLSNTEDAIELEDVTLSNAMAKNSLYASQVTVKMNRVKYQNIQFNPLSEKGAALQCYGCRGIDIKNSLFKSIKSQIGGAIHITDIPTNKKITDGRGKYKISNTAFESISANVGGVIYLDHPQSIQIINSTFYRGSALNKSSDDTNSESGIGGAIYYQCSIADPQCELEIMGKTIFTQNYASIKGGAIHYTYYEPKFSQTVQFSLNKAGWYGDSVSSYSQQLKPISIQDYNNTLKRIVSPMTLRVFREWVVNQTKLNNTTPIKRLLQLDEKLDLFSAQEKSTFTAKEARSGGVIPTFYLAHVDKYGQIVSDFDSKIRVSVDSEYYKKDSNTKSYTPVLEGTTQYTSFGGVSKIQGLQFSGAPGYKYRLAFLSGGIDEKLPENIAFKQEYSEQSIEFDFYLELRDCALGEYFTQVGKCIWCEPSQGFALEVMKKPGECKPCQWDKSECKGGYKIGPDPGYWRKSNTSSNFIRCPNPQVCLGWGEPDWNPMGACGEGQTGVLCAQCLPGYSLTGLAKCGKCPDLTSNIVKLVGMVILVTCLFVFMVRSTIAGATQKKNNTSIFMKILMNHFQLILLVSSFNFQWPKQMEVFFSSTAPVSEASTQVVSVDCFMAAKASFSQSDDSFFKTYFLKLVIFALLPLILGLVSYIFWGIQQCIKRTPFQGSKAVATLVISLFTIHPNIVQQMFNDFNCKDIDGSLYVQVDMTIKCWDSPHKFWSYIVAAPSIVVWGLGIPFFALVLMYRERNQLETVETKEKFGFLYAGYTKALFFWEIVIMYRKIGMIFISVFIQPYGVISQALIVFLVMIVFLIANLKKKPYLSMSLNDLETISLLTSSLSIYCGIFFITDIPSKDIPFLPTSVKSGITLSEGVKLIFFLIIMVANLCFFGYWFYKMLQEVRNTLIQKLEKVYLYLFLCGDKMKLEKIKHQIKADEENENLREKYFTTVNNLKKMYKDGKLVLTQKTLERAQVYLNEDRYSEALGMGRREINEKDARRYNRVGQGAEILHNERTKGDLIIGKKSDGMYGKEGKANQYDNFLNEFENPEKQSDDLFEEKLQRKRKTHNGKIIGIRPESQNTFVSGEGYIGEQYADDSQSAQFQSTSKLMTGTIGFDSLVDDQGHSPSTLINSQNGPGQLEQGLNHRGVASVAQLGFSNPLTNFATQANSTSNMQNGIMKSNLANKQKKQRNMQNQKAIRLNQMNKSSSFNNFTDNDKTEDDLQKDNNKIWEDFEEEVKQEDSKKKNEKLRDKFEKPDDYQQSLDISTQIQKGHIQVQANKVNEQSVKQDPKQSIKKRTEKKAKPIEKKAPKPDDQIERELYGEQSLYNEKLSDVEDAKSMVKQGRKQKRKKSSDVDDDYIFSDDEYRHKRK